ncbi:ATP-binding protein [Saccharopolyspora sp. SCSIO 74807]|uniref:ATP-binding protein n=1 Tax=Saccharopolyspora sp. SCSIO 74807 TaxID=3118084 RepID=UPI0030D561B5
MSGADLRHLWARLRGVENRVRVAVAKRRATDPAPDDPYRGLYLTDELVERILDSPSAAWSGALPIGDSWADEGETAPEPDDRLRLPRLAADFGLTELDVELLLVALAPEVDPRFERFYGYLNDDVTLRRPTTGLALELCGMPLAGDGRFRLAEGAPLSSLLEVAEPERPWATRTLRVPDRVVAHLLGSDAPPPALAELVREAPAPRSATAPAKRLAGGLDAGIRLVHLRSADGSAAQVAVESLAAGGFGALVLQPQALTEAPDPAAALAAAIREARLRRAGLIFGPLETVEAALRPLLRRIVAASQAIPVFVHGASSWDPGWARESPVSIAVEAPELRAQEWRDALEDAGEAPRPEHIEALTPYRLGPDQVRRAASVAARLARLDDRAMDTADLRAGVRAQNGAGLERLARRITPSVGWDDLVLPESAQRALTELSLRARHRDRVLGEWRMRPGGGRGRGVLALFAGESGTGKTMSAEVVAADLGMDLYVIDLSTVVDKYVGETEKNLERIFTEAAGVNGVLLFDEADAIFGKRSQVKDAHDRYANVESAYLLQRMESFDGLAVLTTNLRANLDEAFTRRLDVIADFPMPEAAQRRALWDRCLGTALPRAEDLDLDFCAERFELSGGSIRACAVTAAYLAAEAESEVGMPEVIAAVRQEYAKLGRLILESEFR